MLDLKEPFKLGDWTVLPTRLILKGEEEERRLEPKAMEMLVFLAENAGETVSRDTLGREIWPGTYGSDEALSRIISLLRSQLGDDSRSPRYIETIPKVGYRLITSPQPLPATGQSASVGETRKGSAPGRRLALAAAILFALLFTAYLAQDRGRGGSAGDPIITMAVLPLDAIGNSESDEFLSVGLTNEIIGSLNRSPLLRIVTRNSLENLQSNGNDGGIDYFLAGSVGTAGESVRVFAEITDSREGSVVWSDSFESPGTDYLEVQQVLSNLIFSAINRELGIEVESPSLAEIDMNAYTAYLNGIFLSKLRGEEPLRASAEAFSEALRIEPEFDNARVALANVQVLLPYYSSASELQAFAAARDQLDALQDQRSAEAEAIRGFMAFHEWRWSDAEQHFQRSLAMNPDIANTHVWYSQFLSSVGRLADSLSHARTAYELDPVSPVVIGRLATALLWLDQDEEASRLFAVAENLGFSSFQNRSILILLLRMRDYDTIRQGLRSLHPGADLEPLLSNLEYLENPEARPTLVAVMEQLINGQLLVPTLEFGVWIVFEQWERTIATINKYPADKKFIDIEMLFAREAQEFRESPGFQQAVEALGLDNYWRTSESPDYQAIAIR